ncbi:hypothetical protein G5I_07748 [Acromyrmex echinatior]|uniref:Uncharacterized protein n=1 Tax=Acromyrmex echinatior TaxID=103372 RepID=F4WPM9_ACREC|nr:hypothetical protein G5I_07748 [Acromyrmex echinatior]
MVPYNEAKRLITAAVFEDDVIVYVKEREKRTWLWNLLLNVGIPRMDMKEKPAKHIIFGYCPLSTSPPSPPPSKEKARYWECPGEKASKSPMCSSDANAIKRVATSLQFLGRGESYPLFDSKSYVEIALRDHRGHELLLSLETWKGLYEQRWNIYKMLRNEYKDNFISVGPLTVSVCMLNDATLERLNSSSVRMMMTETMLRQEIQSNIIVDLTQLRADQLRLFHRLIEITDEVDDLTHVHINRIAFNHLIDNLDEMMEEEEVGEEVEEEVEGKWKRK